MNDDLAFVKLEIFVPHAYITPIREALNAIGAGHIGNYDNCISVTAVTGYWRPLPGAEPFDGEVGQLSEGTEYKIEVNCRRKDAKAAVAAVRANHPYDHPLINIIPLLNHLYDVDLAP